jgi:Tfp pilus assembly protein PilF
LFGIHPLHVESVAWVAERKDVLSGFFFTLTLLAYARCVESVRGQVSGGKTSGTVFSIQHSVFSGKAAGWYWMALTLFACGLMSKPMLVTLPFVLLLLDYWPLGRMLSPKSKVQSPKSGIQHPASVPPFQHSNIPMLYLLLEKVPFFVLSAASSVITMLVQRPAMMDTTTLSFSKRLGNAAVACVDYLRQTVWPTRLAIFYPHRVTLPESQVVMAAGVLILLTVAVLFLARRRPYAVVGWFWYLGMLVPVIGLVQVGLQARADRYTYLPLIGIFVMVAWGLASVAGVKPKTASSSQPPPQEERENIRNRSRVASYGKSAYRWPVVIVSAAMVIALAAVAWRQVGFWKTNETLFSHVARVTDRNYMAYNSLGITALLRHDTAAALKHLHKALGYAEEIGAGAGTKYYIGAALQMEGKGLEALPWLEESTVIPEQRPERNYRLGLSLLEAGRVAEAENALKEALNGRPDNTDFQLAMAALHHKQGANAQAEETYKQVIATHPGLAQAHKSYGDLLVLLKRPTEALAQYATAVKEAPNAAFRRVYASTLIKGGKTSEAIEQLREALKLEPGSAQLNMELGDALSQAAQNREAIVAYEKAIELNPKQIGVLNNLAWLLATCPDDKIRNGQRAVELAQRACQSTEWKAAFLIGTLAASYAEAGDFKNAVAMAEKARTVARDNKQEEVAQRNEELMELYRAGKAYREQEIGDRR